LSAGRGSAPPARIAAKAAWFKDKGGNFMALTEEAGWMLGETGVADALGNIRDDGDEKSGGHEDEEGGDHLELLWGGVVLKPL
jgi:hypothetical protein